MNGPVDVTEAAAIHDVRVAFDNRLQKRAVVARIVFEVGILNDDDITGGGEKTGLNRAAFSLVFLVQHDFEIGVAFITTALQLTEVFARAVSTTIVNDHDFQW